LIKIVVDEVPSQFVGTSNVYLAMKYGIPAIGTMAHQWICAFQHAHPVGEEPAPLELSQHRAFMTWAKEYQGDLGIALSDTIGRKAFLDDLTGYLARLFDGARHDSGDPRTWLRDLIKHYEKLHINLDTKKMVFSNSETFESAAAIHKYAREDLRCRADISFGLGGSFGNNLPLPYTRPNFVIKMIKCNGKSVAKITEDPSKAIYTDEDHYRRLKEAYKIEE
jgi:nicotinate phosphoribosyltransferase